MGSDLQTLKKKYNLSGNGTANLQKLDEHMFCGARGTRMDQADRCAKNAGERVRF